MRLLFLLAMLVGSASIAKARPVSYPTGWTIMQLNDTSSNAVHTHYSPTAKYSIGYKAEYFKQKEWQFHGLQLNNLLKRWNRPDSQANLYLKSGIGIAYSDNGIFNNKTIASGFTGLSTDWETRRYFVSYENRGLYAGDISKNFSQKARVGIAPYIGNYGDLHTWLMLQVDHSTSSKNDNLTITPLIRLFKGPALLEAGVNNNKKILFNLIYRF